MIFLGCFCIPQIDATLRLDLKTEEFVPNMHYKHKDEADLQVTIVAIKHMKLFGVEVTVLVTDAVILLWHSTTNTFATLYTEISECI